MASPPHCAPPLSLLLQTARYGLPPATHSAERRACRYSREVRAHRGAVPKEDCTIADCFACGGFQFMRLNDDLSDKGTR